MSDDQKDSIGPDAAERKGLFEIRTILIVVALIAVAGAAWVAVNGSNTAHRRAIDSSETSADELRQGAPAR